MLSSDLSLAIILVALSSLAIGLISHYSAKRKVAQVILPPGPKGWPVVGNILGMPSTFQWKTYKQWSIQYSTQPASLYSLASEVVNVGSDIIHTNVLGQSIIIIDKYDTAIDLLDKRSGIYSSR
jgi:hypothetical protein